jgi:hypothetical protein
MERAARLTFPLLSLEETGARLGLSKASQKRILEIVKPLGGEISLNGHPPRQGPAAAKRVAAKRAAKRLK